MDEELEVNPAAEDEVNEEETTLDSEEESIEDLRNRLAIEQAEREKAQKAFEDQKKRAEIAEKKAKQAPASKQDDISTRDAMALVRANVADEDVDQVAEYARFKKIPIAEALKTSFVQTLLAESAEMRRTAEAANTGVTRRSNPKTTPDALLAKARSNNELPDSDDEFMKLVDSQIENSTTFRRR